MRDGCELLEQVRALPGGRELLELADGREDVELVGGAVRDLLLGITPHELDVVVGGAEQSFGSDAALFARELASRLGAYAEVNEHESFGTALVRWGSRRVDVATRRTESYAAPGALPTVSPGTPAQDLARRDFTVNAIAVSLGGSRRGELRHVPGALDDLEGRVLRVLHERSFSDDPTRLLRLARYAGRLDFTIEAHTAELVDRALHAGALATVSGARLGSELRLALGAPEAFAVVAQLARLGLLGALHPRLRFDESLILRALALLDEDELEEDELDDGGMSAVLLLAAVGMPLMLRAGEERGGELRELLDRLQFPASTRNLVVASALAAPGLVEELAACTSASELFAVAVRAPAEAIALAGALGGEDSAAAVAARRWVEETRLVSLQINGDDLIAAGIPGGPELGDRLHATLMLRLDGEIPEGREAELAAALAWVPR